MCALSGYAALCQFVDQFCFSNLRLAFSSEHCPRISRLYCWCRRRLCRFGSRPFFGGLYPSFHRPSRLRCRLGLLAAGRTASLPSSSLAACLRLRRPGFGRRACHRRPVHVACSAAFLRFGKCHSFTHLHIGQQHFCLRHLRVMPGYR